MDLHMWGPGRHPEPQRAAAALLMLMATSRLGGSRRAHTWYNKGSVSSWSSTPRQAGGSPRHPQEAQPPGAPLLGR